MISLGHYLILSGLIFCIGLAGVLRRKNILMLFFSTEIMLNAINIGFVAIGNFMGDINGQMFAIFIIAIAASEVAIGLGLVIMWFKKYKTLDIDNLNIMKG
ncbi:NADH-quinone oxidoreductase subunit NuoK [Helicobacter cappadocius]|uniref:NADH-quinone oxidoreductase subunit K n=1 Tax=Helicobacter cappadocius TaxID=3063998 RepID=A0AA90PZY9_9HELI|nr:MULTISPECIES: NADH-quinone oxidoreductase subunit NuoK [unclassified Helicobacter]MDO7253714.1 NADH-quinone oxidoreductase subunit NuoK [Helicobacter sp. faydin-H75]MDP2539598.1 NADH-quinone oxidoreductase subunit NuoK [Helicobacter sp. faydin-H76]